MAEVPADIAAFVAVHIPSRSIVDARKALVRIVGPGGWFYRRDDRTAVAVFSRITSAFEFVNRAYDELSPHMDTWGPKFGIACGETPKQPVQPQHLPAVGRAIDLAMEAYEGQTLVGPGVAAMGQDCLPSGYGLIDQGQIRLGNRIAAEHVSQLKVPGHPYDFPPPDSQDQILTNIEVAPSPIGRDREATEIMHALIQGRLVTLTGPAGVGKSCLSTYVGHSLASVYRDGAWKVDLASVPRGGNVATAIAAVLDIGSGGEKALDRVQRSLTSMEGLLILDNCEHLIPECVMCLTRILRECPKVRFILSSRDQLGLEEEYVIPLGPFELPEGSDDVENSDAVRLFLDRARKSVQDFTIRPSELATIAAICRRLGGLPLGIELAAAQVAHLSPSEILNQLKKSDKKIENAIAWSYSLLDTNERDFFRRCGVLVGTTNRDLILAVGADKGMAPERAKTVLTRLVRASLLQVSGPPHAPRYRLLEPLREFALAQFKDAKDLNTAKLKFAKECKKWLIEWKQQATSNRQRDHHLRREAANLHAAVEHLISTNRSAKDGLEMCRELGDFWVMNGPYDLASQWFEEAIAKCQAAPKYELARAYNTFGILACYAGEYGKSEKALKKALAAFKKLGDDYFQSAATQNLALTYRNSFQIDEAVACARQALELVPAECVGLRSDALANLAAYLVLAGKAEEAHRCVCESIRLNEDIQNKWSSASHHSILAQIHEMEFRLSRAKQECRLSIPLYWETGDVQGLLSAMEREARLRLPSREFERAAVLLGGTKRHFDRRGVARPELDKQKRDMAIDEIKEEIGAETLEALIAFGETKNLQELYFLSLENSTSSY